MSFYWLISFVEVLGGGGLHIQEVQRRLHHCPAEQRGSQGERQGGRFTRLAGARPHLQGWDRRQAAHHAAAGRAAGLRRPSSGYGRPTLYCSGTAGTAGRHLPPEHSAGSLGH